MIKINVPFTKEISESLHAGDLVYLSGTIYVARDAAHMRLKQMLDANKPLPFDLKNNVIYYMGPSPARNGKVIGSAGPTTASRMDRFTPELLDLGLIGMIGKGKRTSEVYHSICKNKSVYFGATGGVGALISHCIIKSEVIAFDDLGAEAIRKLEVKDFPVIVVADCHNNCLYK